MPLDLAFAGAPVLQAGRVLIQAARARGLATAPLPQAEKEALDKMLQTKVRVKNDEDCKMVLKVCDAEECIEQKFNDSGLLGQLLSAFIETLWSGFTGSAPPPTLMQSLGEAVKKCLQEKALRQDSPRKYVTKKYSARPSRK